MRLQFLSLLLVLFVQTIKSNNPIINNNNSTPGFIENKGQFKDMRGNNVPHVLFKTQAPGVDFYITKDGLTYLFKKTRKVEKTDSEMSEEEKNTVLAGGKIPTIKFDDWERVDVRFVNSNISLENVKAEDISNQGYYNYYLSNNAEGITNVKEYRKLRIENIYPDIDLLLYNTSDKGFKYDFVLHSGAKISDITVEYDTKNKIRIDEDGNIIVETQYGEFVEQAPVSFYDGQEVYSKYKLVSTSSSSHNGYVSRVQYDINSKIPNVIEDKELVIDPILSWSTLYGTNSLEGFIGIKEDNLGFMVISGYVTNTDFPYESDTNYYNNTNLIHGDEVIIKMDKDGNILWTTVIGGDEYDAVTDMGFTSTNSYVFVGVTKSTDLFTMDAGGYFETVNPGSGFMNASFLGELSDNGMLIWHTYSHHLKRCDGFVIDSQDNIYCFGQKAAIATNVFLTGAYNSDISSQSPSSQALLKFDNGRNLIWATNIKRALNYGGALDIDSNDNLFLVVTARDDSPPYTAPVFDAGTYFKQSTNGSRDLLLLKFNPSGVITWGTFFGGDAGWIRKCNIVIDNNDDLYVVGETTSSDYPLLDNGGLFNTSLVDGISTVLSKFSNSGSLLWSSYLKLGSTAILSKINVAISPCDNHLIFNEIVEPTPGLYSIPSIPYSANSFQYPEKQDPNHIFVEFNEFNDLIFVSYFDGDGTSYRGDITVDSNNDIWMVGEWILSNPGQIGNYPLVQGNGYYDDTPNGLDDCFIAKFKSETLNFTIQNLEPITFCDSVKVFNQWRYATQNISITEQNQYGCDSIEINISIIKDCPSEIYIPNVCSPNGDKVNDTFYIMLNNELITKGGKLTIYNRWGNNIFVSENDMEWHPENVSTGVYYYIFEYKGETYTGTISLFK